MGVKNIFRYVLIVRAHMLGALLALIFYSCNEGKVFNNNLNVHADSVVIKEQADNSVLIEPKKKRGNLSCYEAGSFSFVTDSNAVVKRSSAADFVIFNIIYPGIDTFGFYAGNYPSLPNPLNMYFHGRADFMREEKINELKKSKGSLTWREKVIVSKEYINDTTLKIKEDTMRLEIQDMGNKYMWARLPEEGKEGPLDIVLEFKNKKTNLIFHLMAYLRAKNGEGRIFRFAAGINLNKE